MSPTENDDARTLSARLARAWHRRGGRIALILIGLTMVAGVIVSVRLLRPDTQRARHTAAASGEAPSPQVLRNPPKVEPLEFVQLPPEQARGANDALPMVPGPPPAATPFRFAGSDADRAAARDCLAGAVLYEAGDDKPGQQAVAQVVLNRMRHPAFPKTVCGVVLQGSERTTGCQFTFTCDGALARIPNPAALERARAVAEAALGGYVAREVGWATHYHTDWVFPYWAPSLDKIARVHTHLFYRWKGWWGTRGAFGRGYAGGEAISPLLALRVGAEPVPGTTVVDVPAEAGAVAAADPALSAKVTADLGLAPKDLKTSTILLADERLGTFVLKLDPATFAGDYALTALNLCDKRASCSVAGYLNAADAPKTLPLGPADIRRAAFYHHSNNGLSPDTTLFNCRQIARSDASQCLPGTR